MNRREAEELLPWFVAGTLSEDDAQAVQAFIDSGDISTEELAELALFAETVAGQASDEPAYDPAILKKALAQLDGVTQEAPEPPLVVGEVGRDRGAAGRATGRDEAPGLLKRLLDAMQWSTTPPLARLVVAAQFALLLGLAVIIGMQTRDAGEVSSETVSGESTVRGADFSISFAPGISEADVRTLLLRHRVSIVGGPSALGIYQIAAPEGADLESLAASLQASPQVVYLQPVPEP